MDSDIELMRPSRAPRSRTTQPPTNEPGRHPRIGGASQEPRDSAEINPESIDGIISFFTISPADSDVVGFNVGKINIDPDIPHDWTSIVVSKTRTKKTTDQDGNVTKEVAEEASPMVISQQLLDRSIVKVEEEMTKIRSEGKFSSDEHLQQQMLRERMLDVYRHASGAS